MASYMGIYMGIFQNGLQSSMSRERGESCAFVATCVVILVIFRYNALKARRPRSSWERAKAAFLKALATKWTSEGLGLHQATEL